MIFDKLESNLNKKLIFQILFIVTSISLYLVGLSQLSSIVSTSFYDLSITVFSLGVPLIILLFLIYLTDIRLATYFLLLTFPFIAAVGSFLQPIGGELLEVTPEIVLVVFFYFAVFLKYPKSKMTKLLMAFTALWLFSNLISFILSVNLKLSFPCFLLACCSVLFASSISTLVSQEKYPINYKRSFFSTLIEGYLLSILIFTLTGFALLYLAEGLNFLSPASLISIIRPNLSSLPGFFQNNGVSSVIIVSLPISLTLALRAYTNINYPAFFYYSFVFFAGTFLIFLDKSRGAFLVLVFYFMVFLTRSIFFNSNNDQGVKKRKSNYFLGFSLLVFITIIFYIFMDAFLVRLVGKANINDVNLTNILYNTFISSRGLILKEGFLEFLNYPLFGKGYSNTLIYLQFYGISWPPHNMLLEILLATGIFGVVGVSFLIISTYFKTRKAKKLFSPLERDLNFSIWLSILGLLAFGFTTGSSLIESNDIKTAYFMNILLFFLILLQHLSKKEVHLK